jgi:hypothetical protein
VIWRDGERGRGRQFGAQMAFSPDGNYLFLAVGDRQRMTPAQEPLGKILRLTLDGKLAPANPMAANRRGYGYCNRSARRHGEGQERAGDPGLCISGPEHDVARAIAWPSRQTASCGRWSMPQRWRRA